MLIEIENKVIELLVGILGLQDINSLSLEDDFISLGINSISFIHLIVGIEEEFGFEVEDSNLNFHEFRTIKELVEFIHSKVFINSESKVENYNEKFGFVEISLYGG